MARDTEKPSGKKTSKKTASSKKKAPRNKATTKKATRRPRAERPTPEEQATYPSSSELRAAAPPTLEILEGGLKDEEPESDDDYEPTSSYYVSRARTLLKVVIEDLDALEQLLLCEDDD